jgi:hypothetical protein
MAGTGAKSLGTTTGTTAGTVDAATGLDDGGSTAYSDAGSTEGGGCPGADGEGGYAGDGACAALGCAGKTYKLCEDFEDETGTVGAIPTGWSELQGYGPGSSTQAVLATDQFHSGRRSLKSDSATNDQRRVQRDIASLGATATKHWGRIFYLVQDNTPRPSGGGVIHTTFTALEGPSGENRIVDTVENSGGLHQWLYNLPSDQCSEGSAYDWTFEMTWHCAEWYIDVSTNSYRFYSDAVEVPSIGFTGKTCTMMSQYTAIGLGTTTYQNLPGPLVVWFDDLAIDDNRIGCQ